MPLGCTANGNLDESKYNEPMPWIGIYVAAASAACAAAMAFDVFKSLRYRKFWFPCKLFSLNATTLTLIGVASKLSVDLNSSMPQQRDQLAKLSSGVLICTVMSNSMPSLGTMESKELAMNIMALGIFVITVVVNIGIQLGTGVIYVFWREHILVMFVMIVLLLLLISSALTVPTTKSYFDLKYSKKYKMAQKECGQAFWDRRPEKLKEDLMTYWMMAHTCSPQFVAGRLVTCTASGAFTLLSTVIFAEAVLRSYLLPETFKFCNGESDYKWSTSLILVTQTIAILVGTIAPASRWFGSVNYRCPKKVNKACRYKDVRAEDYWIRSLVLWKESPLDLRRRARFIRRFAHNAKKNLLDFCIWMQMGIVCLSKLVRLVSLFWVSWLLIGLSKLSRLLRRRANSVESHDTASESSSKPDLSRYVLHLEGEESLIDFMMKSNFDASDHWIKMGKKRQPKNLIKLLETWDPKKGFMGANKFDSEHIPALDNSEVPPNCWALPVVTLTSIAIALLIGTDDSDSSEGLIRSVQEAMLYMRFLEDKLDANGNLTNLRKAAQMVWVGVDLHYQWLDLDLRKMAPQGERSPEIVLKALSEEAKQRYIEYKRQDMTVCFTESPSKWPAKILAANSMYRICQALLLNTENEECHINNSKIMFHRLSEMITGLVGACLTNLPRVIYMLCHQSSIEERANCVRFAIILLGKAGKILEILGHKQLPSSSAERLIHIDDWRALSKEEDFSLADNDKVPRSSSDLYLTVE